ncbi:tubulin-tyrosine ligase family protein, putative [Ichthyophthirius multifiliis]|uniref:Tubulin-tyrosine ligase family protein, putative n=1 Tax=Ichthyophthirius multifiliis TaxID=5932 RepID=G0R5Z2_ICHMU|nr:tubulin-tyrosine ligase family protein, putative [Ichthyophthirius multifiliis]EGR27116.1 tubulin-tyrosine ligase family protein, putative [Ichthyophthirius multifiliis]|eukprot:XP_004024000.1 tubulin-tyrosine ligase family protein, putative [Ichthyophthirius multifiliis]
MLIGKGNNSELVRNILLQREKFGEANQFFSEVNIQWQPWSRHINNYNSRTTNISQINKKICNHFEFHDELTQKNNLVQNLKQYCLENKKDVFQITPLTFEINIDSKYFQEEINDFCQFLIKIYLQTINIQQKHQYKL